MTAIRDLRAGESAIGHRQAIATFDRYTDSQVALDRLALAGFPVERCSLRGDGVCLVEQVTGRLDWLRVFAGGAATGALLGTLIGWVVALITPEGGEVYTLILYSLIVGTAVGAVGNALAQAAASGGRDFTSRTELQAERYLLLVDDELAAEAANILKRRH
jgi:hypothetical protein